MNFLKKIFGSSKQIEPTATPIKIKRTLADFFAVNFNTIPDETFFEGSMNVNTIGETVRNYQKRLNYYECGIFDTIEIMVFEKGSKNIFFKNYDLNSVSIDHVKKLIDDLYLLNGKDDADQGTFNSKDQERFYSTQFDVIFGRRWSDSNKYKYPLGLRINRANNEIILSIW